MDDAYMKDNSNTLCSAAWSDINVNFASRTISHCCMMRPENFPTIPHNGMWNNSLEIQTTRQDLLNGIQATACSKCWGTNITKGDSYRDVRNIWKTQEDFNNKIKTIEIMLDNICDMSCVYCFEESSSRIAKEKNIPAAIKLNPNIEFIDSFINFIVNSTEIQDISLNFSGGEITYSKNFFSFIEKILSINELTNKRVHIGVITNCNSLIKSQDRMLNLLTLFPNSWTFGIAISNESSGEVSELVRYGLSWDRFKINYERYLSHSKITSIVLSPAFSIFTVKHMYAYFDYIFKQTEKYKHKIKLNMFGNWIQNPSELDPANLGIEYKKYIYETKELFFCYKHLFEDNFEFSINSLDVLERRIGTKTPNAELLHAWLSELALQKKDDRILKLFSLM